MTASDSEAGAAGGREAGEIIRSIERLTRLARRCGLREVLRARARSFMSKAWEPDPAQAEAGGWWVLAQGAELDANDFASREAARDSLLGAVRACGVTAAENTWVWDDTGRAQLVVATVPTRERAERLAERLRARGLRIAVRREIP